ncbi:Uncharacterized protein SCF082_LOCUS46414 [Durusdinium trenchii]|uniref:Uncharacterized protein n=1 Tax=Durusdinium trenchii TaxID=1381693 RepID=A0ABP0REQ8_9DINO
MQRETLLEEIRRLTNENSIFSRHVAKMEAKVHQREKQLQEMSINVAQSDLAFNEEQEIGVVLKRQLLDMQQKLRQSHAQFSEAAFRHKQLVRMHLRALDMKNLSKQRAEAGRSPSEMETAEASMHEYRMRLKQTQQETETLRTQAASLGRALEDLKTEHREKYAARGKMLSEIHQLRIIQIDTILRRKDIMLQARGDLTKQERKKLRQSSLAIAKRRTVVDSVLANAHCQLSKYERVIRRIQAETGIRDLGTVVERFFSQESKRKRITQELEAAQAKHAALKARLEHDKLKLQHARDYGVESSSTEQVHDLGSIEQRVRSARVTMRYKLESMRKTFQLVVTLVDGILPLAKQLFIAIPAEFFGALELHQLDSSKYVAQYGTTARLVCSEIGKRIAHILKLASANDTVRAEIEKHVQEELDDALDNQFSGHSDSQLVRWPTNDLKSLLTDNRKGSSSPLAPEAPGGIARQPSRLRSSNSHVQDAESLLRSRQAVEENNTGAPNTEQLVLRHVERSLNSFLQTKAPEVFNASNIRVKPRPPSPKSQPLVLARGIQISSPVSPIEEGGSGREQPMALGMGLDDDVDESSESSGKDMPPTPAMAGSKNRKRQENRVTRRKRRESTTSNPSDQEALRNDTMSRSCAEDADAHTLEAILDDDGADPSDNCFAFLQNGFRHGVDDVVKLSLKNLKLRFEDKLKINFDLHDHNKLLFELIGENRFHFAQPEAITAKELYSSFLRKDMKRTCFARSHIKMISTQLLNQDDQSSKILEAMRL